MQNAKQRFCFHFIHSCDMKQEFSRKLLILILSFKFQSNHQLSLSQISVKRPNSLKEQRLPLSLFAFIRKGYWYHSHWSFLNPQIPTTADLQKGQKRIQSRDAWTEPFSIVVGPMKWKSTFHSRNTVTVLTPETRNLSTNYFHYHSCLFILSAYLNG